MAVNNDTAHTGPLYGDGSNTSFPFDFIAASADEVAAYVDGLQLASSAFSVALQDDGTGTVTTVSAPANGAEVYLASDPSFQETVQFERYGPYFPDQINPPLDRAAIRSIYLRGVAQRALLAPIGEAGISLPGAAARANKMLAFDGAGNALPTAIPTLPAPNPAYAGLFLAYDADGNPTASSGTGVDAGLRADLAATNGAALVKFTPIGTGSIPETTQSAIQRLPVFPEQFGAVGDGVADDTAAWIATLAAGKNILARKGAVYYTTASLGAPLDGATIDLNGSKIVGDWEQSTSASDPDAHYEAIFYMTGRDNVTIRNGEIEYTGTFDIGGNPAADSYNGLVSCIHANECDNLTIDNCQIHGANRGGILIGALVDHTADAALAYSLNPRVINCDVHHCRVANVIYGRTENGVVDNNQLRFAGHILDIGTGYGFAGYSTGIPKNTTVTNNHAVDNYRKGIDFHAGISGVVSNNIILRNRCDGIYIMGVSGAWTVTGNVIANMLWTGGLPAEMCAMRFGELVGQGTTEIPTNFNATGNTISDFGIDPNTTAWTATTAYSVVGKLVYVGTQVYKVITPGTSGSTGPTGTATSGITDGTVVWGYTGTLSVYPIFIGGQGMSYGRFNVSNNIMTLGRVLKVLECQPTVTGSAGNYFDVSFDYNQILCAQTDGAPFTIRGTLNRKKSFTGNQIEITTPISTAGFLLYDNTSVSANTLVGNGNDITCPASAWSGAGGLDPIGIKRTAANIMLGNTVNGAPWRDWDGAKFIGRGTGASPTDTVPFWTVGSIWQTSNPVAGGSPGSVATTAGFYAPVWQASHAYSTLGQTVTNDSGKVYTLITAGTSAASGGPTGTTSSITDGTAVWKYAGTLAVWKAQAAIAA